jgi:hypothetical protein
MRGRSTNCGSSRPSTMLGTLIRWCAIMAFTAILLYGYRTRNTLCLLVVGPLYTVLLAEGAARERRRLAGDGGCLVDAR